MDEIIMSSIRSILEDLLPCVTCGVNADIADGFGQCTCGNEKLVDQALKDISELIDGAKPEQYPISELNIGVNEYQSNLKELLK